VSPILSTTSAQIFKASIHLPQINFMVIQASVVEEMCAFSALDNVRDITCVSLLALGIQVRYWFAENLLAMLDTYFYI